MAVTNDHTVDEQYNQSSTFPSSDDPTNESTTLPIRSLVTETDAGEIVTMEIRPKSEGTIFGRLLNDAFTALERFVDKSAPPDALVIATDAEYTAAWDQLKRDKIEQAKVDATLRDFANIAFRAHRTITGKINEYGGYAVARIAVYDPAIVAYDRKKEDERTADEERIRQAAIREDETRKKEEAAVLKKRGDVEGAKAKLAEPTREFAISVPTRTPKVGGGSIRKRYKATVVDEDKFIPAVARPDIYREIAAWLKVSPFAKGKNRKITMEIANAVFAKASTFPTIPSNMVEAQEAKITQVANASNGKLDWPGVAVEEDRKASARTK